MNDCNRRRACRWFTATIVALYVVASAAKEPEWVHALPLLPSASDGLGRLGIVRVINHSDDAGEVRIEAIDDEGESYGPVTLSVEAGEAVHFNSHDLESGNAEKGLSEGVGAGEGAWRLELSSELDIEVLSYVRSADGVLAAMHDTVPNEGGRHRVAFFNPANNTIWVSRLRLVNPGEEAAEVSIVGVDDRGESPGSEVTTTIPAGTSRTFSVVDLESGGEGLEGALGDGEGKWRLMVESAQPLVAMSLLSDSMGRLTNVSTAPGSVHFVPYLPSGSDALGRQGFVRVINHSTEAGEVRIDAFDDEGESYGPVTLSVEAGEAVHFNSHDLESGNAEKGLSEGVGAGEGAWRLELSSELDIEVLSYVRSADGVLAAMHDTVPNEGGRHRVAFFNPANNTIWVSRLRLVNPGEEAAEVSIVGVDDRGESPGSEVTTTIPAGTSRTFSVVDLESGGEGLEGALGDGEGKWRLMVESAQPLVAMSLLSDSMGRLTNLSTAPGRESQGPPDLVVVSPSVSNSRPVAGAAFTLSATVRNDGDAPSPVTVLRYYRSSDATITTTDRAVGTDAVAGLAASGSASESVVLTAPASPGTYYYGACVDAVTDEVDATNNCSASVRVNVQESESESGGKPDLMVARPTVSDSGPAAGTTFILSVTVRNAGDGASPSATLRYYRSSDATITTSDTPAGTEEMAELGASGSGSKSVEQTAPASPGTHYYGACVDAVAGESTTTNNCSASVEVRVPEPEPESQGQPELGIHAVSVAASPGGTYTNDSFTLSATVRNSGDGDSPATTLRYYRSTDATVTTSDTEVGTDAVAGLTASGNGSASVDLTAPSTPGTYYYGACVDAVEGESDITNNCSASRQIEVLDPHRPPNLVVGSPWVSDDAPVTGEAFTLSATVRNDGVGDSAATTLRYYRSTDATITTSDAEVDTDVVAGLAASASSDESVELTAPSTPGPYYYGACVDAVAEESDTTDNCSASVKVDVEEPPKNPDLEVGTPTVDEANPETGATFTLSATVSNAGDAQSAATTLRYYRSTDATITTSDTAVGTDDVAALSASGTSAESIELTAPSDAGSYYYGACVDEVAGESDTTDNCSTSVQVTVPAPAPAPDQVAAEVAPSPSAAGAGNGEFYVHWIPSGDGGSAITKYQYRVWETGQTAPATWTDISLSDSALYTQDGKTVFNATGTGITTFDHRDRALPSGYTVELRAVDTVGPGTAASATLTPATYWFEIEPLSWDNESIDIYPVLVFEGVEVRFRLHIKHNIPNGHVVQANSGFDEPFTLGLAITDTDNALAGSPPSSVLFAANDTSEDVTLQVADDDVGAADKEVTLALSSTMTSPSNVFLGRRPPSVPFIVYDNEGPPSTPTNLTASPGDGQVTLTWTTPAGSVASTKHRYCRRMDSSACTVLNWRDIPNSGTGETNANSYTVTRLQNGTEYTFRVRAVHAGGKSGVSNEATATPQVPEPAPDLVVATPTVSDSGPHAGATFTLSATVTNDGDGAAAATTLRYYRSTDATVTTSDTEVGTDAVAGLTASGNGSASVDLTAPSTPGTYYYGACVDAVEGESDITNNCSASRQIEVLDPHRPPNLVVGSPWVSDDAPVTGEAFTLSATVRNDGVGDSAATTLRYYRSTDATITTSDAEVDTDVVAGLAASASSDESVELTAPTTPGPYYYGACVDAVAEESDTTDNCSASVKVDVEEPPKYPDLEVGTPTVDEANPETGATFTLSATVSNAGDGESAATTLRYYRSSDATITTSDAEMGTDAVAGLAASASSDKSVELTAPSTPGPYYYGACVDAVAEESDTTDNCSASVKVDVEEPPKNPDLEVGTPTVDEANPETGATFTLSATVSNAGDAQSAATTLRYYRSTDATITTSDTAVGTDDVAALSASGTSAESIELTAPSDAGSYYYGACVDEVAGESDTTDNCSTSVQVTVPAPAPAPDQVAAEVAPSPSAAGAGNGEFYVHWIPSGDGGSAITKYQYRVWETGQTAPATWTDISLSDSALYTQDGKTVFNATGTGITTFDHRDRALPSGYTVELRAVDTVGPGTAASATLTPATYWFEIEPLSWDNESIDIYPVLVFEGVEVRFRLHIKHNIPNGHVVQANSGFDEPFTLGLAITDTDNALAGSPPSSVLFAANDTSEDVTLQVADDDVGAADKEVTLALSSTMTSPSNVFLGRRPPSVPFIVYDNEGPPSTPTNLTASPGDGQVTLTWTTPAGSVASTKHRYCRRMDSSACTVLNWRDIPNSGTGETNANSYTVTRLQNGTEYTFRVRAVHAGGKSGVSNEATATPQVPEPAPDLVVATPTVSDSGPHAGATFTLSATVTNDGDGAAAATTLRYYRSTDATVTTSDSEVGTDDVGALSASGTSDESISLTAPLTAGAYYYGACVDAVTDESDTTNNCSASVKVDVEAPT